MNEKRAIEVLENETRCVDRRARGECNGGDDCKSCDLLMTDIEIKWAYAKATKLLHCISSRRAIWKIDGDGYVPYCSRCGKTSSSKSRTKYCDHCGAKMDEEENNT